MTTPFKLGITMAGAISAGAYTAGAMDYIIEVFEKWEAAKARNRELGPEDPAYDHSIPMHDVEISILSGASAGGMTAIITSSALQTDFPPIKPEHRNNDAVKKSNPLYNSWVNLTQDDMLPELFDTADIEKDGKVISLLNSGFKDKIASRIARPITSDAYYRPYISPRLEILVSLSNLNGIPFEIGFRGNANRTNIYKTTSHRDYAHFVLNEEDNNDGRIPLSFKNNINLKPLAESAMATGAFPIGLAARPLTRPSQYLNRNPHINPLHDVPDYSLNIPESYATLNSDGGMLNNEPFDITHTILTEKTNQGKEQQEDHNTFASTVLMVDPFPTEPEITDDSRQEKLDPAVMSVIGLILSTMRGELSFKRDDLEVAYSEDNYSRFLISPSRDAADGTNYQGNMAIACGSLGGFGGFFDKSFRDHDFFLGRRNAQYFLRQHFCIPAESTNPYISTGYSEQARQRFSVEDNGKSFIPILPDMDYIKGNKSANSEPAPVWPTFNARRFNSLKKLISKRLEKVILSIAQLKWLFNALAWIGIQIFKNKIADRLLDIISKDFKKRKLLS